MADPPSQPENENKHENKLTHKNGSFPLTIMNSLAIVNRKIPKLKSNEQENNFYWNNAITPTVTGSFILSTALKLKFKNFLSSENNKAPCNLKSNANVNVNINNQTSSLGLSFINTHNHSTPTPNSNPNVKALTVAEANHYYNSSGPPPSPQPQSTPQTLGETELSLSISKANHSDGPSLKEKVNNIERDGGTWVKLPNPQTQTFEDSALTDNHSTIDTSHNETDDPIETNSDNDFYWDSDHEKIFHLNDQILNTNQNFQTEGIPNNIIHSNNHDNQDPNHKHNHQLNPNSPLNTNDDITTSTYSTPFHLLLNFWKKHHVEHEGFNYQNPSSNINQIIQPLPSLDSTQSSQLEPLVTPSNPEPFYQPVPGPMVPSSLNNKNDPPSPLPSLPEFPERLREWFRSQANKNKSQIFSLDSEPDQNSSSESFSPQVHVEKENPQLSALSHSPTQPVAEPESILDSDRKEQKHSAEFNLNPSSTVNITDPIFIISNSASPEPLSNLNKCNKTNKDNDNDDNKINNIISKVSNDSFVTPSPCSMPEEILEIKSIENSNILQKPIELLQSSASPLPESIHLIFHPTASSPAVSHSHSTLPAQVHVHDEEQPGFFFRPHSPRPLNMPPAGPGSEYRSGPNSGSSSSALSISVNNHDSKPKPNLFDLAGSPGPDPGPLEQSSLSADPFDENLFDMVNESLNDIDTLLSDLNTSNNDTHYDFHSHSNSNNSITNTPTDNYRLNYNSQSFISPVPSPFPYIPIRTDKNTESPVTPLKPTSSSSRTPVFSSHFSSTPSKNSRNPQSIQSQTNQSKNKSHFSSLSASPLPSPSRKGTDSSGHSKDNKPQSLPHYSNTKSTPSNKNNNNSPRNASHPRPVKQNHIIKNINNIKLLSANNKVTNSTSVNSCNKDKNNNKIHHHEYDPEPIMDGPPFSDSFSHSANPQPHPHPHPPSPHSSSHSQSPQSQQVNPGQKSAYSKISHKPIKN